MWTTSPGFFVRFDFRMQIYPCIWTKCSYTQQTIGHKAYTNTTKQYKYIHM
jgi:hypothetical protein